MNDDHVATCRDQPRQRIHSHHRRGRRSLRARRPSADASQHPALLRQGSSRLPAHRNAVRRQISDHTGLGRQAHRLHRGGATVTTSRDLSRPAATMSRRRKPAMTRDRTRRQAPTSRDRSRQTIAMSSASKARTNFCATRSRVKDDQIKDLTERARETNHLIAGLQKMLTPLLGGPQTRRRSCHDTPDSREGRG